MASRTVLSACLALTALCGCAEDGFPIELLVEEGCSETDEILIRRAAQEVNDSLAPLVGRSELIRIAGRWTDHDGFSRDDLEDGLNVFYCLNGGRPDADSLLESGIATATAEDIIFDLGRLTSRSSLPDPKEFDRFCSQYTDRFPEWNETWPSHLDQAGEETCIPNRLRTMVHEMGHAVGIGELNFAGRHGAVMCQNGLTMRFTALDKAAFCCRNECVVGSPECDLGDVLK